MPRVVRYSGSETSRYVVEGLRVNGKRTRKFFGKRREAEAWLRKTLARMRKEGESAVTMPEDLRVEAVKCAMRLQPYGKTLTQAVDHYLAHLQAVQRSCTVAELRAELLKTQAEDGASDRYLKDLRLRLERFEGEFGARTVADITPQEVDDWLRGLGLSAQSRNNYRTVLRTFFGRAVERNYARENVVEKTGKARVVRDDPAILTPEEMERLLKVAPSDFVPWLTIGGFAGLRSAEIERLDWSEIDLAERLVKLPASKSKTGKKRNVTISDNLAAWLSPIAQTSGPVADPDRIRVARAQTVQAAGMSKWPGNALRHSFASYHLAQYQDAPKTAYQLGHSSPKMLAEHYDAVATAKEAAKWWQIAPESK